MIRVHRIPYSTNVERVALAAAHKSIEVDWVDHDPSDRAAVIALSGQGLVPVAELDGRVVRGSIRIVEALDRERPDPPLYPADPGAAARARIFVSWFDRVWKGPPNALCETPPPPDAEALAARLREWTGWLEGLLGGSPFLGGERLGIADVAAFPFLKYAALAPDPSDRERAHAVLHEQLAAAGARPALAAWIGRVDALPRA